MPWIYRCNIWCDDCGLLIRERITKVNWWEIELELLEKITGLLP